MSLKSSISADNYGERTPSLAACLERFGLPSEPLDSSTQATPRLYLGACGLQAVKPLPRLQVPLGGSIRHQELDESLVHLGGSMSMRTPSPHHTRAWARSPGSFSATSQGKARSSPSRPSKDTTLNSVMDAYSGKPDKSQGLQQLLAKQNTWRRKQASLKHQRDSQSLPRSKLLSDARRKTPRLPASGARVSTSGPSSRRPSRLPSKEAGEEVPDRDSSSPSQDGVRNPIETEFNKALQIAKNWNFPLHDVKDRLNDFRGFKNGREVFTVGQFCDEVKDKYNLEHKELLASFRSDGHEILDFEMFLLWSMKTDFHEEMLVPDVKERRLRQIVREHGLDTSEIDKVRAAYDGFDIDGNGRICHEEFKSLLCKLRMMKSEGDIPEPELKRCWRDACPVEQEMQAINFEQFLVWILKSGELARYREMREYYCTSSML